MLHMKLYSGIIYHLALSIVILTSPTQRADSFIEMYHGLLNQAQYKEYHDDGIAGVAYDSMWSIALGLDKASKKIAAGNDSECSKLLGDLVPLEEFDYSNEKLGCILKSSMDEVSFIGVTVRMLNYKTQVYMHRYPM